MGVGQGEARLAEEWSLAHLCHDELCTHKDCINRNTRLLSVTLTNTVPQIQSHEHAESNRLKGRRGLALRQRHTAAPQITGMRGAVPWGHTAALCQSPCAAIGTAFSIRAASRISGGNAISLFARGVTLMMLSGVVCQPTQPTFSAHSVSLLSVIRRRHAVGFLRGSQGKHAQSEEPQGLHGLTRNKRSEFLGEREGKVQPERNGVLRFFCSRTGFVKSLTCR